MGDQLLTIGELSRRSGLSASAIRYYEQVGLVASSRTEGNQRRFSRSTLRRLAIVKAAQRFGLTLDEVRQAMAALPSDRAPTARDWRRLSERWRERIEREIARLEALRDQADSCIGCGCLSLSACGLFNADDELAARGPGAHRLERPGDGT